jgi:hypothetical protein
MHAAGHPYNVLSPAEIDRIHRGAHVAEYRDLDRRMAQALVNG